MDTPEFWIVCAACVTGLIVGYALGRLDWVAGKVLSLSKVPTAIMVAGGKEHKDEPDRHQPQRKPVCNADPLFKLPLQQGRQKFDIDTRKFVAPVTTDGMVRLDQNELGTTVVAQDKIDDSVSRLAQLKGS